jgi:hypothetical protein
LMKRGIGNKKGALPVEWLVGIILTILGVVVIGAFLYGNFSGGDIDREACRVSVNTRATLPYAVQGYVPLKCQTEKICITGKLLGKGECEEFEGVKNFVTMRVGNNEKGLKQIEQIYAQETLECWNIMGRGELSLFSSGAAQYYGLGDVYSTCVVCSRIAIDGNSLDKVPFQKLNVQEYMLTHAVPGTEKSYFDFMFGENYAPVTFDGKVGIPKSEAVESEGGDFEVSVNGESEGEVNVEDLEGNPSIDDITKESAILFMQIDSPEHGRTFLTSVGTVLGIDLISKGFFGKAVVTSSLRSVGAKVGIPILALFGVYQQGSVAYNRAVAAGYCGDIKYGSEAREGCSAVRVTNYDLGSIRNYCQVIESIP